MSHPKPEPLARFAQTLRIGDRSAAFSALDALFQDLIGHRLFSCSQFQLTSGGLGHAARVYTSDEANYPTSGIKEVLPNRWTQKVIDKQETFVANTVDGFSDVFPDHGLIESLGLGSVVNLPVVIGEQFLGTVNVLHQTGHFTDARLTQLGQLEVAAQLAFLRAKG